MPGHRRTPDDAHPGSGDPDFDRFYLATRRRLVLEAYALTGDLSASRSAVRDAYVAASQHWRKVGRLSDPEEWVRPRAWAMAQRRHVARLWHREKGLSDEQLLVLDALHHLPDQQRRVLLLTHLADLTVEDIGRELGETPGRVQEQLAAATRGFCRETGRPQTPDESPEGAHGRPGVLVALESLAPIAEATALPGARAIHQGSRRRRRVHGVTAVVVLIALTLVGGLFVTGGVDRPAAAGSDSGSKSDAKPVTEKMLLSLPQVQQLAPREIWQLVDTSDNTSGTGINSVCQDSRFADPQGRGTFVRKFAATGKTRRNYLQTVEVSRTAKAATVAYRTTLGWFAGCGKARVQLLHTYRVNGLGEEAQLLQLRIPGAARRSYVVGVVRTGSLTVSTVLETLKGRPVRLTRALIVLNAAARNLCVSEDSGPCPGAVTVAPVQPPASGETPGTLAAADLPLVGNIARPWVGTNPVPARPNVAATTCDKTNFVRNGAPGAKTRTYVIPQAKLPQRFGIAQTYGEFASPAQAAALVRKVTTSMRTCEKRDLGTLVSQQVIRSKGYRDSEIALWRVDSEINRTTSVGFWMGVARVGRYVAQVNFTPTGANDVDKATFLSLMIRARDRLFELPAAGTR